MGWFRKNIAMPDARTALPDRSRPIVPAEPHVVLGHSLDGPYPSGSARALFGLGCFWGAERKFWQVGAGIHVTAVGYAGGFTKNPTYEDVCTGMTGHNEVVLVVFDPAIVPYEALLRTFWENHDPTQGMRQGNDIGTQYRSGIYVFDDAQRAVAEASRAAFGKALAARGFGAITTEILPAPVFYFAETYHQQYLARNPGGYCGLGGTGVACPIGVSIGAGA